MAFYKIGVLWVKKDKRKRHYLTGTLTVNGEKVPVSIYKNEKKEVEKQPDWLIYEQKIDRKYLK